MSNTVEPTFDEELAATKERERAVKVRVDTLVSAIHSIQKLVEVASFEMYEQVRTAKGIAKTSPVLTRSWQERALACTYLEIGVDELEATIRATVTPIAVAIIAAGLGPYERPAGHLPASARADPAVDLKAVEAHERAVAARSSALRAVVKKIHPVVMDFEKNLEQHRSIADGIATWDIKPKPGRSCQQRIVAADYNDLRITEVIAATRATIAPVAVAIFAAGLGPEGA